MLTKALKIDPQKILEGEEGGDLSEPSEKSATHSNSEIRRPVLLAANGWNVEMTNEGPSIVLPLIIQWWSVCIR